MVSNFLSFFKTRIFSFVLLSISTSCVIILFSITTTVKKEILNDIENMGAYVLRLSPDIYVKEGYYDKYITYEDLLYLKKRCKFIKRIAMWSLGDRGGQSQPVIIEGMKYSTEPVGKIIGTLPAYKEIKCLKLIKGRFINEVDIKLKRRVCVVGNTLYTFLGGEKIIGKKLKVVTPPLPPGVSEEDIFPIPKESFTVIGALARIKPFALPGSYEFLFEDNDAIFIPYPVMKEVLIGGRAEYRNYLFHIFIQLDKSSPYISNNSELFEDENERIRVHQKVKEEAIQIINILKERYGQDKKFSIYSEERLLDELEKQTKEASIFIKIIGTMSLIASIVSISSIMLISVTNRISEIGICRAVGARKRDIFLQFLKETLIITAKGGIGGIILGLIFVWLMGKYTSWEVVIPIYSLLFSIGVMGLIAIISGLYPAIKAANISPAVVVKYE